MAAFKIAVIERKTCWNHVLPCSYRIESNRRNPFASKQSLQRETTWGYRKKVTDSSISAKSNLPSNIYGILLEILSLFICQQHYQLLLLHVFFLLEEKIRYSDNIAIHLIIHGAIMHCCSKWNTRWQGLTKSVHRDICFSKFNHLVALSLQYF